MPGYNQSLSSQGKYNYDFIELFRDKSGARILSTNERDNADDDYFNEGFGDYTAKTTDPGPLALVATTVISLATIAMIPVFVWVGEKLKKRRKRLKKLQERQDSQQQARTSLQEDVVAIVGGLPTTAQDEERPQDEPSSSAYFGDTYESKKEGNKKSNATQEAEDDDDDDSSGVVDLLAADEPVSKQSRANAHRRDDDFPRMGSLLLFREEDQVEALPVIVGSVKDSFAPTRKVLQQVHKENACGKVGVCGSGNHEQEEEEGPMGGRVLPVNSLLSPPCVKDVMFLHQQEEKAAAAALSLENIRSSERGVVSLDKERIPDFSDMSAKHGPHHEVPATKATTATSANHGNRTQNVFVPKNSTTNNNEDGNVKEAPSMDKSCASSDGSKSSALLRAGEAVIAALSFESVEDSEKKKRDPPGTSYHEYLPRFLFRAAPPSQPIEPVASKDETASRADASVSSRSSSSVVSRLGLKGVEELVEEYLATGEIYHPKERDLRRINGTGEAMQLVFGGGSSIKGDDSASSRLTKQSTPEKQVRLAIKDGKDDDSSSSSSSSSSSDDKNADENLKCYPKLVKSMGQYKFYRCDRDMRGILKLAVPFTIHSFAIHIFGIMELAVVGQFIGTKALSAYLVVDFVFSLSVMFMEGSLTSLFTLCSQAVGTRNLTLAGQYIQIAALFYQVLWLPFGVLWYFFLEDVVLLLGFEQDVADMAFSYAEVAFIWYLFRVYIKALHYLLEVTGHENYTALMSILTGATSFTTILLMAKNLELSLRDVGIIHLGIEVLFACIEAIVQIHTGWLSNYWGGMLATFAPFNRQAVRNFLKTSVPLSFGYILSYGEWEVLAIFAGFMGPAEVSAWGLLGNFWEAIEEVSLAVADASEVRTANMLGSNQPARAKSVAYKGIFVGIIVSFLFSIPIYAMSGVLPSLFTKDETLQGMLSDLIPYVCVGNIVLMFGSMCWSLVGAQGRYGLATTLGFVGSWIVTLPLSALLTIPFNFDLQGLAAAVVIGYSCSGALTASFLFRSNWEKLSKQVVRDAAETDPEHTAPTSGDDVFHVDYEDYDWDELPDNAQVAACKLGYDERMWNKGREPDLCQCQWDELEPEQQEAARVLGYTKAKWDGDD